METNLMNTVFASIITALDQYIKQLVATEVAAALAAQPKPETEAVVDTDKLRELVAPIVATQIDAHCQTYDHDDYDSVTSDFRSIEDDIVTKDGLSDRVEVIVDGMIDDKVETALDEHLDDKLDDKIDDKIEDALEDKVRSMLRNASVSIDV